MAARPCTSHYTLGLSDYGGPHRAPPKSQARCGLATAGAALEWDCGGYLRVIAFATKWVDDAGMKKRAFAAVLWFYVGWYGGAMLAEFLGVSPLLGPLIGTAAAALFVGDPRGPSGPVVNGLGHRSA